MLKNTDRLVVEAPQVKPKAKPKGKRAPGMPARVLTPAMIQRHEAGEESDDSMLALVENILPPRFVESSSSEETTPRERQYGPHVVADHLLVPGSLEWIHWVAQLQPLDHTD